MTCPGSRPSWRLTSPSGSLFVSEAAGWWGSPPICWPVGLWAAPGLCSSCWGSCSRRSSWLCTKRTACPLRKWCGTSSAPASSGPAPGPTERKISTRRSLSAQQTIPYVEMLKDGICRVREGFYTKTISYEDINYSVASSEDQSAIFDGWCGFLNYFDSALPFQLSFINHRSRGGSRYKVNIPMAHDDFDSIRGEYVDMLKRQIATGSSAPSTSPSASPPRAWRRPAPGWSVCPATSWATSRSWEPTPASSTGGSGWRCCTARCTPEAGSRSASPGRTL